MEVSKNTSNWIHSNRTTDKRSSELLHFWFLQNRCSASHETLESPTSRFSCTGDISMFYEFFHLFRNIKWWASENWNSYFSTLNVISHKQNYFPKNKKLHKNGIVTSAWKATSGWLVENAAAIFAKNKNIQAPNSLVSVWRLSFTTLTVCVLCSGGFNSSK